MITIEKLKEYELWQGSDDLYHRQGEFRKGIITPDEWSLIDNLRSEAKLLVKNLAAKSYADSINDRLVQQCENLETVEYLKQLAQKEW